MEEHMVKQKK